MRDYIFKQRVVDVKDSKVNKRAEQIECLECLKLTNDMLEQEILMETT